MEAPAKTLEDVLRDEASVQIGVLLTQMAKIGTELLSESMASADPNDSVAILALEEQIRILQGWLDLAKLALRRTDSDGVH